MTDGPEGGRPVIGVTVSRRTGWRIFPLMALNVRLAGARPVRWVVEADADLAAVDGVVIGGGDDVSPELYGGPETATAKLDPARDALERRVIGKAFARGKPVLGICRGSQMINVVLGGTLDQDAYATHGSRKYTTILPRKTVAIEPGTRLHDLLGGGAVRVNALHTQAVDRVGDGLRVAARDEGGMIQAVERVEDPFALGVQWHPEHLPYTRHRRLFAALAAAARAARDDTRQVEAVDEDAARA